MKTIFKTAAIAGLISMFWIVTAQAAIDNGFQSEMQSEIVENPTPNSPNAESVGTDLPGQI